MSFLIIISFSPSIPSQRYVGGGDIRNALQWMISSPSFQILKTNPFDFSFKNQTSSTYILISWGVTLDCRLIEHYDWKMLQNPPLILPNWSGLKDSNQLQKRHDRNQFSYIGKQVLEYEVLLLESQFSAHDSLNIKRGIFQ